MPRLNLCFCMVAAGHGKAPWERWETGDRETSKKTTQVILTSVSGRDKCVGQTGLWGGRMSDNRGRGRKLDSN